MNTDIRHNRTLLDALIPQLAPLQDLPPPRLQRLIDESSVLDYAPGHYVFRQGDRDAYLFYLLQGELDLYSDGELVSHLRGGTQEARFALAQLQPRQLSAIPRTTVQVLRVQRERLDHHLHAGPDDSDAEPLGGQIASSGPEDWITRMLKSPIFARLPVANIQRLFAAMEAVEVEAGQSVIQQGQAADACYVINEGLCEVQRHLSRGEQGYKLAQLGPGERFGEEALVAGGIRNATVRTLTNCTLMRLDEANFHGLVVAPVLKSVTLVQARAELSAGARWLDVRYPDEQVGSALPDSLDLPLNVLRQRAQSLDPSRRYIACCDNGIRGAVAAFLVTDAGCDCVYLAGGLEAYPEPSRGRAPTQADSLPVGVTGADNTRADAAQAAASPAETTPVRISDGRAAGGSYGYRWASAAGSPDPVSDHPAGGVAGARAAEHSKAGSDDPEVQAAVLKARLAQARLELHEALRIKQEAERAHAEEQEAKKRLEAQIDSRSQGELARAQALFAEAEAMRRDLEEARRHAEVEAERLKREAEVRAAGLEAEVQQRLRERDQELLFVRAMKREELAAIQQLRAEAEAEVQADRERLAAEVREAESRVADTHRHQQEVEAAAHRAEQAGYQDLQGEREHVKAEMERANALVAEAEAMKRELEQSKRLAEADALHRRREEEERLKTLEASLDARVREREQGIDSLAAMKEQELERARMLREEAERQACAERERLEQEAREVEARMKEAQRHRERIEREMREAQGKNQAELEQERTRIEAEMQRADALVAHAEAMKRDIAEAKRVAEHEAARQRQVEEERIRGLKAKLKQKLRSREREIDETAKRQSDELAKIHRLKEQVAAELAEERKRFAREAMEAKKRLCQAERAEHDIEMSRIHMAEEVDRKHQDLLALEKSLRSDIDTRLAEDKRRLEADLSRAAGELAVAQREREAAEADRQAAAAEAERKIAEYRSAFERMHAEEEAKLKAEKARIEAEAERIQGVLDEARRLKRVAEAARIAAEQEVLRLKRTQDGTRGSHQGREVIDTQIKVLEQKVARAQTRENAAARAQDIAEGASQTTAADLERQRETEARLRAQIDAEVAEWRREQDAFDSSPDQLELTARLDHQIEAAKQMAKAARRATLAHDEKLLKEVSVLIHRA
ncbi:MAG: cyclic nucleotide-binding domain-containing protein [Gammaproteobacteria bacterium]